MTVDSDEQHRLSAAERIGPALSPGLLSAGGVLSALAASSCCLLPLILFSLGVSGAWIGNLTRLAPYQPYFLGAAAACLGAGYWRVWRSRRERCGEGDACARPLPRRTLMAALVFATILVAAALILEFVAPWLLAS